MKMLASLLRVLCQVVPWQMCAPAARDVTLFQDAEFQMLLRELRHAPMRGLYGVRFTHPGVFIGPSR